MRRLMFAAMIAASSVAAQHPDLKSMATSMGAKSGGAISISPKIKPDKGNYYIHGRIQDASSNRPAFLAYQTGSEENEPMLLMAERSGLARTERGVFYVNLPKNMASYYFDNASINQGFDLIGAYTGNRSYTTGFGNEKAAPVLTASYFRLWGTDAPYTPSAASAPGVDLDECIDAADGDTVAIINCTFDELDIQDARLNDEYKKAMRRVSDSSALRNAQRQWIKDRDAKCELDEGGGQAAALYRVECLLDFTANRADQLSAI